MKTFFKISAIIIYLLASASIQAQDIDTLSFSVVKMKNGTLLIGKILNQSSEYIEFNDNMLGKLMIEKDKTKYVYKEEPAATYMIKLNNGNELTGKITDKSDTDFQLKTTHYGLVSINYNMLADIKILEGELATSKTYWFPNPNDTRYFFAPSAIPIKKNEGYYQNAYVLVNSANYGVGSNFSLGGGVVLPVIAYVTPKFGVQLANRLYIGGGVLFALLPESTTAGIGYGLTTYGTPEHNLTFGIGYGYIDGEDNNMEKPIYTINGMTRIGRKFALVSENWIVDLKETDYGRMDWDPYYVPERKYRAFVSYGMRFMWDRFTIDAAFINGYEIYDVFFIGVPYIDFVVKL